MCWWLLSGFIFIILRPENNAALDASLCALLAFLLFFPFFFFFFFNFEGLRFIVSRTSILSNVTSSTCQSLIGPVRILFATHQFIFARRGFCRSAQIIRTGKSISCLTVSNYMTIEATILIPFDWILAILSRLVLSKIQS